MPLDINLRMKRVTRVKQNEQRVIMNWDLHTMYLEPFDGRDY